ncbi:ATP-binding protein [archaeon]|nr:ATP-binding protein [archaeon]
MKINVLSGKGGVGKSTVASSLASILSKKQQIIAVDCDVDTPNLGIFFGLHEQDFNKKEVKTSEKAVLIPEKCTNCKKCVDACMFSAISWENKPVFNRFLCEGCGACQLVCPENAIKLIEVKNGWVGHASARGLTVVGGQLKPGEAESGVVVMLVKQHAEKIALEQSIKTMIIDSAAGIGCPVIASITGSDYVIAVTEPTPPALTDLKRALTVVEHFGIPYGIVINKYDLNPQMTNKIEKLAVTKNVEIIGKLPYDKAFIDALVQLKPVVDHEKRFEPMFQEMLEKIPK